MRTSYLIIICVFSILILNSSFSCVQPPLKVVSIDSIQYFSPNKIILWPDDFNFSSVQLNVNDGIHTFYKDSTDKLHSFRAEKDEKNYYIIEWITANSVNDSFLSTNIHYQAFDKKSQLNSSKIYNLKHVSIPLKNMNSFRILFNDYLKFLKSQKL